ncbi:MAG: shikimate kinase [Planctomycetaceae bacterium]
MVITLIGYRGSGKSSVAPRLAARFGFRAVDADDVIEARAKMTIREIFAKQGEPEFRRLERETLVELLAQTDLVLSAGGGAILNAETRADMRAAGPVVWLQAPVDVLAARIGGDPSTSARRPNLSTSGGQSEIEQLLTIREPLYREAATLTVDTTGLEIDRVVDLIADRLGPQMREGGVA